MTKKSYAKVNIFLKIVGTRGTYHLLASRFCRVKNLYDEITFVKGDFYTFTLEGDFSCKTEQNTIYKAYLKLKNYSSKVNQYFKIHKIVVDKNIPEFAGLGGGSSNCATFILMVNDVCSLGLSKNKLSEIGASIGADVPFFIYEFDSANVSSIGEIVEEFEEEKLNISTFTPKIKCNTSTIFKEFRKNYYKECSANEVNKLFRTKSIKIYNNMDIKNANDLYEPAFSLNNKLNTKFLDIDEKSFFSGSGSSFFVINS
jgi:4-diphosphocytidyl-2-C-methyl-D-erythritol kinase